MEFRAVVEGDRHDAFAVLGQRHHVSGLQHRMRAELLDDRKTALALHRGQHAMALVVALHHVAFPMHQPLAALDFFGQLAVVPLARQDVGRTLSICEALDPKGHHQKVRSGTVKGCTGVNVMFDCPAEQVVH
jgi:hypothetical protein